MITETCIDNNEISVESEDIDSYNQLAIDLGLQHLAYNETTLRIAPMNAVEERVYKTICPKQEKIEKYTHHIPVRVLEAMSAVKPYLEEVSKKEERELTFEVWTDTDPDPVLVAKTGFSNTYLIGRWGHELDTYAELKKRAIERITNNLRNEIAKMDALVNEFKSVPDSVAMRKLEGNMPYFSL